MMRLSHRGGDTNSYSGSGFEGEDEHFVFDAFIELDDADDDWATADFAAATAHSGQRPEVLPVRL
jgi:hypothetical protein